MTVSRETMAQLMTGPTLYAYARRSVAAGVGSWSKVVYVTLDKSERDTLAARDQPAGHDATPEWRGCSEDLPPTQRLRTLLANGCVPEADCRIGIRFVGEYDQEEQTTIRYKPDNRECKSTLATPEKDYCNAWLYVSGWRDETLPEYGPTSHLCNEDL